jgi:hypothetical protein
MQVLGMPVFDQTCHLIKGNPSLTCASHTLSSSDHYTIWERTCLSLFWVLYINHKYVSLEGKFKYTIGRSSM